MFGDGQPHHVAAEGARAIAATNDSQVHVIHVADPGGTDEERAAAREKVSNTASIFEDTEHVEESLVEGTDVVGTIEEMTDEYDLTIIGATREGMFQQLLYGVIPERVGQRAHNTVIMAKRDLGLRSRLKRWFPSRNTE